MLINCGHRSVKDCLKLEDVNNQTGAYLHQMLWAGTHIGALPIAYNYLEGWHTKEQCPNPVAVHFTRGGPWFRDWGQVEYADEWLAVAKEM